MPARLLRRRSACSRPTTTTLEDGAASVKDVAHRVAYTHVSNFIHAYRARYGKPPRRHLRQRREELAAAE